MCAGWMDDDGSGDLLHDPLIRLVMHSDGVTEEAMMGVMRQLRNSLAAREQQAWSAFCDHWGAAWRDGPVACRGSAVAGGIMPMSALRYAIGGRSTRTVSG